MWVHAFTSTDSTGDSVYDVYMMFIYVLFMSHTLLSESCTRTYVPGTNGGRWRCTSPLASGSSSCAFAIGHSLRLRIGRCCSAV